MGTPPQILPERFKGPGLVDLQVNGYAGFDFNSDPAAWTVGDFAATRDAIALRGVVAALPTCITADADDLVRRARRYAEIISEEPELETVFPKMHIEGPFISPDTGPRGAHRLEYCRTPKQLPDLFDRLCEASGDRIGIFTLAPELDGAIDQIGEIARRGAIASLGHTNAAAEQIAEAVAAGASMATHLGNGSHMTLPRLDNYVLAQLADDRLSAGFIADGHHMPFWTLKSFLRAKTFENSFLVTDAIVAAGVGPGSYEVMGATIVVTDELRAQIPGQANLAGSALTLDRAVVNVAVNCGVDFETAWAMASTTPARLLGLDGPKPISVRVSSEGFQAEGVS